MAIVTYGLLSLQGREENSYQPIPQQISKLFFKAHILLILYQHSFSIMLTIDSQCCSITRLLLRPQNA